jgi:hypothetical protein
MRAGERRTESERVLAGVAVHAVAAVPQRVGEPRQHVRAPTLVHEVTFSQHYHVVQQGPPAPPRVGVCQAERHAGMADVLRFERLREANGWPLLCGFTRGGIINYQLSIMRMVSLGGGGYTHTSAEG